MSSSSSLHAQNAELIASLFALASKSPKLVRSSVYEAPADPTIKIHSFKMNEFKYYDIPSPFPTLARGLFTRKMMKEDEEGEERVIVIRGYDKFFNIGEVPWTTWSYLEDNTSAPYTLSLKSNGCIIFIAALTPTQLLVTSKHSLGPVSGVPQSHAEVGEQWLEKHLEKAGKTKEALAQTLWENDWTAIAELCDDNFEEHVLAYPPEKTGLHLHGINLRSKAFATQPTSVVDAFADEWGFIKTPTVVLNSIKEVREFTDECAKTGEWNGEPVEGFVVRTTVTGVPVSRGGESSRATSTATDDWSSAKSPYEPGSSFFFKVKFDEPYMMYRDWREVTKMLLRNYKKGGNSALSAASLPKSKMKRPETKTYVKWVIGEIRRDPAAFDTYSKGKGIIATRERFLEWLKTDQGKEVLSAEGNEDASQVVVQSNDEEEKVFGKTIIVPVAIPGCGKTSVAVALAHLFDFGHTQSDDVKIKKAAPVFLKNVASLLETHDVVIADKNNHLKQHRTQLRDLSADHTPPTRLLALNWSLSSLPSSTTHRICTDRVLQRGPNHQSLIPDTSASRAHEDVIWMFITSTEDLSMDEVDACIEMNIEDDIEQSVRRAIKGIVDVIPGLETPSEEKIQEALALVSSYEPKSKANQAPLPAGSSSNKPSKKGSFEPRYFGILPEIDTVTLFDTVLKSDDTVMADGFAVPIEVVTFWRNLKAEKRAVIKRPHVTIVHSKTKEEEKELWEKCLGIHANTGIKPPLFKGRLGTVLCDGRVLCVTVEDLEVATKTQNAMAEDMDVDGGEGGKEERVGEAFIKELPEEVKNRLHITLGTKAEYVQPVESKALVEKWRAGDKRDIWSVELGDVEFVGRLKGLMG